MKENDHIEDLFLQALIRNDGLKTPSRDFTSKVMAKLPSGKVVVKESSRFIGKNLTLLIFLLIAVINLVIIYLIWPYLSVWLPENSLFALVLANANDFIQLYFDKFIDRSATLSLLIIIGFGVFILFGRDEMMSGWNKITKRLSI